MSRRPARAQAPISTLILWFDVGQIVIYRDIPHLFLLLMPYLRGARLSDMEWYVYLQRGAHPRKDRTHGRFSLTRFQTQDNLEEYFQWRGDTEWATDCEECSKRLVLLERFWQVVANNYYGENFSETAWAKQLLDTVSESQPLARPPPPLSPRHTNPPPHHMRPRWDT